VSASEQDEQWLEDLRRQVYRELLEATFGGWDEERHLRQFTECLKRGEISLVEVDGVRVGMIQLLALPEGVEVGEIQILPSHQKLGIGSELLRDVVARSHMQGKKVLLSVALKNERAFRLYERLGFRHVGTSETHHHMAFDPPVTE
jgi:ribosomal protein S18 acetylase RimI-like enzyme